jgi:hypothetical protein
MATSWLVGVRMMDMNMDRRMTMGAIEGGGRIFMAL